MEMKQRLCVLGGDDRQRYLIRALVRMGYEVRFWGLPGEIEGVGAVAEWREAVLNSDAVILPLPTTVDEVRLSCPQNAVGGMRLALLWECCRGRKVYAGRVSARVRENAAEAGVLLEDYFALESLQMRNAVPTVEGALSVALEALPVTLFGSEVAVIGYGRIASLLAHRLAALGARVSVYARKESDRLHAILRGMAAYPLRVGAEGAEDLQIPKGLRVIFNTVPHRVFSETVLRLLPPDCLLVDLASLPGGIDLSAAERLGLRAVWATALPGRCFPESAGEILAVTLGELLEGEGEIKC